MAQNMSARNVHQGEVFSTWPPHTAAIRLDGTCSPHNGQILHRTSNSQGKCKQRNGIWNELNMLLASQVHSVALRVLKPSGLHGQGDALAPLHEIGKQPASEAQKHLDVNITLAVMDFCLVSGLCGCSCDLHYLSAQQCVTCVLSQYPSAVCKLQGNVSMPTKRHPVVVQRRPKRNWL